MTDAPPTLQVYGMVKHFPITRGLTEMVRGAPAEVVHAVDGVSVDLRGGETLGLIGESGSGKSTLGWLIAKLYSPTRGGIRFHGADMTGADGAALRWWRRKVQIVFQDPVGSLDPRLRAWQIVGEALQAQGVRGRAELRRRVFEVLPTVGLPPDCLDQYPHEFSGGGRQRLSLARALVVDPEVIVLDEPTSALDVAVQAQILNRLVTLQRERGYTYLLITHNVAAVRYVSHRVAVMYLGEIVEVGPVRALLEHPVHPYTKALLAALPVADVRRRRARYRVSGEVPTLVHPPPGCRFASRCPFVIDRCRTEAPPLRRVPTHPERLVSCHRAEEVGDVPADVLLQPGADAPAPAG